MRFGQDPSRQSPGSGCHHVEVPVTFLLSSMKVRHADDCHFVPFAHAMGRWPVTVLVIFVEIRRGLVSEATQQQLGCLCLMMSFGEPVVTYLQETPC